MYDGNRIIRDARVLREHFIPSRMLHREGQLDAIRSCLNPLLKGMEPRHAFLYGSPGTGKTCLARYVVEELSAYSTSIQGSYINCWESSSRFTILFNLLQGMGMPLAAHRKGTPTDELLDALRKRMEKGSGVVILDEVDRLEDDRVLYDLASMRGACLILISNSSTALHRTDPRVRSRLASAESLEFPQYKPGEILDILRDRAEWGLMPGAVKHSQLERIAQASEGDARVSIDTLRIVAEEAENKDLDAITDSLIDRALPRAIESSAERNLEMLSPHQRLILEVLESRGAMNGGELYASFSRECPGKGIEGVVDRTFRNYVERLMRLGLVRAEGSGRWRRYSLKDDSGMDDEKAKPQQAAIPE